MPKLSILDEVPYVPDLPDLDELNMTIIEWVEEVITENTAAEYISSERDLGIDLTVSVDVKVGYLSDSKTHVPVLLIVVKCST